MNFSLQLDRFGRSVLTNGKRPKTEAVTCKMFLFSNQKLKCNWSNPWSSLMSCSLNRRHTRVPWKRQNVFTRRYSTHAGIKKTPLQRWTSKTSLSSSARWDKESRHRLCSQVIVIDKLSTRHKPLDYYVVLAFKIFGQLFLQHSLDSTLVFRKELHPSFIVGFTLSSTECLLRGRARHLRIEFLVRDFVSWLDSVAKQYQDN